MSDILITGNKDFGLAKEIGKMYPHTAFVSRSSGFDLELQRDIDRLVKLTQNYNTFINCSHIPNFKQTEILNSVYNNALENNHKIHIICIGSTIDRIIDGKVWQYATDKKTLRSVCNVLSLNGVWKEGPKVTLLSLGTLSNVVKEGRHTMPIELAAKYIKWIIDQPVDININELSVDPIQNTLWHEFT